MVGVSRTSAVIHDLGYRPYDGPRLGERPVAWAFFVTGLRNCFGLGRSAAHQGRLRRGDPFPRCPAPSQRDQPAGHREQQQRPVAGRRERDHDAERDHGNRGRKVLSSGAIAIISGLYTHQVPRFRLHPTTARFMRCSG